MTVSAVAGLCLAMTACSRSDDEASGGAASGAGGTGAGGAGATGGSGAGGTAGAGGEGTAGSGMGTGGSGGSTTMPYSYVLIQDHTAANLQPGMAGLDVDAIEVIQSGQTFAASDFAASDFAECGFGAGDNSGASDCAQAVGAPSANCGATPAEFVSLGGEDGDLVVSFANLATIQEGDLIRLHECDATDGGPYDVFVGVAASVSDPNWVMCA